MREKREPAAAMMKKTDWVLVSSPSLSLERNLPRGCFFLIREAASTGKTKNDSNCKEVIDR